MIRIGEVAERVGITPRTIRYYEEIGLLPGGERQKGSHRLYEDAGALPVDKSQPLIDVLDPVVDTRTKAKLVATDTITIS